MNRSKLKALIEGLPDTEREILAVVQYLDQQGYPEKAQDLLVHSVNVGGGNLSRLELAHRLVEQEEPQQALQQLDSIDASTTLRGPVALLRAIAHSALEQSNEARTQLGYSIDNGIPLYMVNAWESYLFQDGDRPEFPYSTIDLAERVSAEREAQNAETGVDSPNPFGKAERTDLISLDHRTVSEIGDETIEEHLDDSQAQTAVYETTEPGMGNTGSSKIEVDAELSGEQELAQEPELELDFNAPGLKKPRRNRPRVSNPGPTQEHQERKPVTTPLLHQQDGGSDFFSGLMAWSEPHLDRLRRSPKGVAIGLAALAIVLLFGTTVVYSLLANSHETKQHEAVNEAIHSDRYSQYKKALLDLDEISNHQILPTRFADRAIGGLAELLPGLGVSDTLEPVDAMTTFVRARTSYRFESPGSFSLPDDTSNSPVLAASAAYHHLSFGDADAALALIEPHLEATNPDPLITIAYGDALIASNDSSQINLILENYPQNTATTAFIRAQMMLLMDEEKGIDYLQTLAERFQEHIGLPLELARYLSDFRLEFPSYWSDLENVDELLEEILAADNPEVSSAERGDAHLLRAGFLTEEEEILRALESAADSAPLHPKMVQPLIEFLLMRGELSYARSQLLRTPTLESRHSYFDIALGRTHILFGEFDRALSILAPYDSLEALGMRVVAHALSDDLDSATTLLSELQQQEHAIASSTKVWLDASLGNLEEAALALEDIEGEDLSPFFFVLAAETHRVLAGLTAGQTDRFEYLDAANLLLFDEDSVAGAARTPERRRTACLTALDSRDKDRSHSACSQLLFRDASSRPAATATIRWLTYLDLLDEAQFLVGRHTDQSHDQPHSMILSARVDLHAGNYEDARTKLDQIPSELHESVDYLLAEGDFALRRGQFDTALTHFELANERSALRNTDALLGIAEATLFSTGPNSDVEESIRSTLRNGKLGPRAWALFASFRRRQGRMSDARENITFADRALDGFGSTDEKIHLITERIAIYQSPRSPGDSRIEALLDEAEKLNPHYWRYHLLATRWHRSQSEVDEDSLRTHLRAALHAAPTLCRIWDEVDAIDSSALTAPVTENFEPPEDCGP